MADETSTETTTETQAQAGAEGHEQGTETLLSGDDGQNKAQDKKAEEEKSHTDELKSTDSPTPSDPEKFDLSMPEGYGDVERAEFVKIAKDLGLTEEQTQKLADHSAQSGPRRWMRSAPPATGRWTIGTRRSGKTRSSAAQSFRRTPNTSGAASGIWMRAASSRRCWRKPVTAPIRRWSRPWRGSGGSLMRTRSSAEA